MTKSTSCCWLSDYVWDHLEDSELDLSESYRRDDSGDEMYSGVNEEPKVMISWLMKTTMVRSTLLHQLTRSCPLNKIDNHLILMQPGKINLILKTLNTSTEVIQHFICKHHYHDKVTYFQELECFGQSLVSCRCHACELIYTASKQITQFYCRGTSAIRARCLQVPIIMTIRARCLQVPSEEFSLVD